MRKIALLGATAVTLALGFAGAASAEDTVKWDGAPRFSNSDLTFKVRGRVFMDFVDENLDRAGTANDINATNTRVSKAMLGVEGTFGSRFAYVAEANLLNNGGNATGGGAKIGWEDLFLEYKALPTTSIIVGNQKAVSLENITSSRFTTLMDRGAYNNFIDADFALGASVKTWGDNWTLAGALLGNAVDANDLPGTPNNGKERYSLNVRGTYAPLLTDTDKVHLGAWARMRDHGDEGLGLSVKPNTNFGGAVMATGNIIDHDRAYGVEAAYVHNGFSLQSEASYVDAARTAAAGGGAGNAKAAYVEGSYFLGGMRNYDAKKGVFARPKVFNTVDKGGMGAIQVAARYDYADTSKMRDGLTGLPLAALNQTGKYTGWTLGATYYPNPYVRFMANYIQGKTDTNANNVALDGDNKVFQMRAQFDF